MVSVSLVSIVTMTCVMTSSNLKIFASSVGLLITQTLILCGMLQRGIRLSADSTTLMTSVERVLQFTKLEQECNSENESTCNPSSGWPAGGKIEFKKFYLRYSDEAEPVLKNVNFVIEPGAKVNIYL